MNEEIRKALSSEYFTEQWTKQATELDKLTNFVYRCKKYDEIISRCKANESLFDADISIYNYALHRWLNLQAHDNCIKLLVDAGAVECEPYDHEKDFTMFGINFDLKLTRYPWEMKQRFNSKHLSNRNDRDTMIRWLYANQSQGSRKHLNNKIFIVVGDKIADRFDNDKIAPRINAFADYYREKKQFNSVQIIDNNTKYNVYSELIFVL